jgi:hydroxymethylbilane synthase
LKKFCFCKNSTKVLFVPMTIRIGTRGSKLALWQAKHIAALLKKGGIASEIITIETKGDKILDKSLSKIGSKGLFTAELEEQLLEKKIDIAVHSAKDVQSSLGKGLALIAFDEREKPHDVVISYNTDTRMADFDRSFVVGTSSTRRSAMLKHYYPNVRSAEARGNLQTRMKKLEEGYYDALILAYAGVHRMNYGEYIVEELPLNIFTPAVGQGAIAIEASTKLDSKKYEQIRQLVNHPQTEACLKAERSLLRKLEGGCSVPIFGYATLQKDQVTLEAGIISLDGTQILRRSLSGAAADAEKIGQTLAEELLADGGKKMLEEIRKAL